MRAVPPTHRYLAFLFALALWTIPASAQSIPTIFSGGQPGAFPSTGANPGQELPLCSEAQPGEACIKDAGGKGTQVTIRGTDSLKKSLPSTSAERPEATTTAQATPQEPIRVEQNDFQRFVAASTGQALDLFGYNLFQNPTSSFAPVDRAAVTENYVVGPGDELLVRAWGQIDVDYSAIVDRSGNIYIPKVGNVAVAGVRYAQLNSVIKNAIGRVFKNFEVNVTLSNLRFIDILVVGHAVRPGSYTVSALTTLVNALFTSGGPSATGSLRDIQLKRNDRVVARLDLYDLLLRGDKSQDLQLQAGDVIYIPPIGPLAAIVGDVNNPAIYELKPGGSTLKNVVDAAGGLSITASGEKVTVERVIARTKREITEFSLDPEGLAKPLQDGDIITVFPLSRRIENAVTLRGNVAVPGRFPWHAGMRVRDLIPSRASLLTARFWQQQTGVVTAPVTPPAASGQSTDGKPTETAGQKRTPEGLVIRGANLQRSPAPGEEAFHYDVKRNAPDINWDYAVIQRLNVTNLNSQLISFNLGRAIDDPDSPDNVPLQAGDVITVFSQSDIRVPIGKQRKYVRLEGEVVTPGVYEIEPGETLRELVRRVGGLTANAYLFGAQFTRESTRIEQQKKLDDFIDRLERDMERSTSTRATDPEDAIGLQAKVESQKRLLDRLRAIKAQGRIVLNVRPNDNEASALPELALEDGDRFYVPYRPSTVSVLGAVYNENDLLFKPGRRVGDYLRSSGGVTRDADKSHIYVVRADGSIQGSSRSAGVLGESLLSERALPGDSIVVPENFNKTALIRNLKDYGQILAQFALGVAALHSL